MRRAATCLALTLCSLIAACGNDSEANPSEIHDGEPVTERVGYGEGPLQFGDLTVPVGEGPFPVVVFIHGGFWRNSFGLDLAEPQAADAVANGYATWNIEYRRVGDAGGGYPGTLVDVALAIDQLALLAVDHPLDLERIAVVGHSAGGHLALWAGQRAALPESSVGAAPVVVPSIVVGQAPVAALTDNVDLGGGAVPAFMGGSPSELPEAYDIADPARLLPVLVPQLIIQGSDDPIVPPDRAAAYVDVADSSLIDARYFEGADHFDVIDPTHSSWSAVLERLQQEWVALPEPE